MEKNTEKVKLNDEQLDNVAGGYVQNQSPMEEEEEPPGRDFLPPRTPDGGSF